MQYNNVVKHWSLFSRHSLRESEISCRLHATILLLKFRILRQQVGSQYVALSILRLTAPIIINFVGHRSGRVYIFVDNDGCKVEDPSKK